MSEKYEQTKESGDEKVGKSEKKFLQTRSDKIRLTFKGTRTFELHIGHAVYRFEGRQTQEFDKSILTHKDWTDETAKNFVVQEA